MYLYFNVEKYLKISFEAIYTWSNTIIRNKKYPKLTGVQAKVKQSKI